MSTVDREPVATAARQILAHGLWCGLEICLDVPRQEWELRVVLCLDDAEAVAEAVAEEVELESGRDARLVGCDRRTLRPDALVPPRLCYVTDTPPPRVIATPRRDGRWIERRSKVFVRDGMNLVVVTVGPEHTLREASRRMTARGVGAAVVLGLEQPGPGIVTERDILHSNGVGQCIDTELVRDHLTSELVYAEADWSLERAATEMVRGGFRHIVVLDGSDVVGILSMRDIVRCWTGDGATCDVPG